jgi:hypothetical protein
MVAAVDATGRELRLRDQVLKLGRATAGLLQRPLRRRQVVHADVEQRAAGLAGIEVAALGVEGNVEAESWTGWHAPGRSGLRASQAPAVS